jgi:hypothetical protein
VSFPDETIVATGVVMLGQILKEYFRDSPLRWSLQVVRDVAAEKRYEARVAELGGAITRAAVKRAAGRFNS